MLNFTPKKRNSIHITLRYYLTPVRLAKIKRQLRFQEPMSVWGNMHVLSPHRRNNGNTDSNYKNISLWLRNCTPRNLFYRHTVLTTYKITRWHTAVFSCNNKSLKTIWKPINRKFVKTFLKRKAIQRRICVRGFVKGSTFSRWVSESPRSFRQYLGK